MFAFVFLKHAMLQHQYASWKLLMRKHSLYRHFFGTQKQFKARNGVAPKTNN